MKPLVLLTMMLLLSLGIMAQEFKSLAAKEALSKYIVELKKIETLKLTADKQYKQNLEAALSNAMKSGSLEEANLIKAEIDKLEGKEIKEVNKTEEPIADKITIDIKKWNSIKAQEYIVDSKTKEGVKVVGLKKGQSYLIIPHPENTWRRNEFPITKWDGAEDKEASLAYELNNEATIMLTESNSFVYKEGSLILKMYSYGARSSGTIRVKIVPK